MIKYDNTYINWNTIICIAYVLCYFLCNFAYLQKKIINKMKNSQIVSTVVVFT